MPRGDVGGGGGIGRSRRGNRGGSRIPPDLRRPDAQGLARSAQTGHSRASGHKSGGRWVVHGGAIVGSQDIPGNGGIGLQLHGGGDFTKQYVRYRNLRVKRLDESK